MEFTTANESRKISSGNLGDKKVSLGLFMKSDLHVGLVTGKSDLLQISRLNETYLKSRLTKQERDQEGFLTWRYELPLLESLHRLGPSVICKDQEQVVGYALTALVEATDVHPEQELLIPQISGLTFKGRPLSAYTYYLMGQLCVAQSHRGRGVVEKMYAFQIGRAHV